MPEKGSRRIKALDAEGLASLVDELGEPGFRATQLLRWLYGRGVASFDEMTDLPAPLRGTLASTWTIDALQVAEKRVSRLDDTRKYLFRMADGVAVESVGMPASGRLTVCFSTQAGCAMACAFCATGAGGHTRDLLPGEIVDQVRLVGEDFGQRVSNAVAMGQGEPFANYEAVLGALRILNSGHATGIGARHLTVSTCGLLDGIARFASEPEQFTLAVSLHSAVQATRNRLMPGTRRHPLPKLKAALVDYFGATARRPTLEYAMIRGENDGDEDLSALLGFLEGLPAHVNLIPLNAVEGSPLGASGPSRVSEFHRALAEAGVETSVRAERGADLEAACGQLRQRFERPTA